MFSNPYLFLVSTVFLLPATLISIPAHELGHALVAQWQGDRTARNRGFFRPEPRLFFTPYGLLALLFWRVGCGAEVPINEYRLKGQAGRVAYALGGPVANLLLAGLFGLAFHQVLLRGGFFDFGSILQTPLGYLGYILYAATFLNISLFAFNLLPVPGLDGWRIIETLFRSRNPRWFMDVDRRRAQVINVLILVLFAASFVVGNLFNIVMIPFYAPVATLIFGTCVGYPGLSPCPPSGHF